MSPVCANGSQIQPGAPTELHLDPIYAEGFLPVQLAWLKPFLPYIPPWDVNLTSFCSADPPPMPSVTAGDLINLIAPSKISLAVSAAEKILELVQVYAWYRFCQCINTSTPAAPAAPSVPTGAPSINPPAYVGFEQSTAPCKIDTFNGTALFPGGALGGPGQLNSIDLRTVANPSTVRVRIRSTSGAGPHTNQILKVGWFNANVSPALIAYSPTFTVVLGTDVTYDFPLYPGANFANLETTNGNTADSWGTLMEAFCGVPPGESSNGLCGPDPRTMAMLNQIYSLLTLVQRNHVPFAYVLGAAHSGLTGDGELTVSGLIGLLVQVTTIPNRVSEIAGDPMIVFDVGSIGVGTADGWQWRRELRHAAVLEFPDNMPAMTKIGYSIPADCVVRITEIEPEAP